jgi:hypothetical protein
MMGSPFQGKRAVPKHEKVAPPNGVCDWYAKPKLEKAEETLDQVVAHALFTD